jgi:hypothetical protein
VSCNPTPQPNDQISTGFGLINTFEGCTWDNPTLPPLDQNGNVYGGAIFLNGDDYTKNEVLSIINCHFMNIQVPGIYSQGNALYIESISCLNISSSTFENLKDTSQGGGGYIYNISHCVLIHNCSFDGCMVAGWGGGLYLSSDSLLNEDECLNHSSRGTLFSCLFKECEASYFDGGGLWFSSPSSSSSIRSCVFDSCSSGDNGGGIYLNQTGNVKNSVFLFFCFFSMEMNVEKEKMNIMEFLMLEVMFMLKHGINIILILMMKFDLLSLNVIQQHMEKGIRDVSKGQ